jgi:hypothetical protein
MGHMLYMRAPGHELFSGLVLDLVYIDLVKLKIIMEQPEAVLEVLRGQNMPRYPSRNYGPGHIRVLQEFVQRCHEAGLTTAQRQMPTKWFPE